MFDLLMSAARTSSACKMSEFTEVTSSNASATSNAAETPMSLL